MGPTVGDRFLEDKKFRGLMDPGGVVASKVYMGLRASIKSFGQDEARWCLVRARTRVTGVRDVSH